MEWFSPRCWENSLKVQMQLHQLFKHSTVNQASADHDPPAAWQLAFNSRQFPFSISNFLVDTSVAVGLLKLSNWLDWGQGHFTVRCLVQCNVVWNGAPSCQMAYCRTPTGCQAMISSQHDDVLSYNDSILLLFGLKDTWTELLKVIFCVYNKIKPIYKEYLTTASVSSVL